MSIITVGENCLIETRAVILQHRNNFASFNYFSFKVEDDLNSLEITKSLERCTDD